MLVRRRLPDAGDDFCGRCWELTTGNPLQVRELLVAIDRIEGPADDAALTAATEVAARSLGRSVLRRLGALSSPAQGLARAVAVYEDDVPVHLAAALAELAPADAVAAAEELEHADVLRAGDPLGFTHPLVRAAVYGHLPFGERARTHRSAARLLAAGGAHAEQVSAHLLHAPPAGDADVVAVLRAAARRALAEGVPRAAVAYLDRAQREPPSEGERAGVLAELGRAEAIAGRPEAVAHLEAAVALAPDPAGRAALLFELGRALHHAGRLAEASAAFRRGLDEAGTTSRELAADLEGAYLTSAMHTPSRAADAHARGDEILAAMRVDSRSGRGLASTAMMMRLFAGRPRDEILDVAHRLDAASRGADGEAADSRTPPYVVGTLIWCDDYRAAADALAAAFADADRRGSVRRFAMASQLRSRQRLCTGPIAGAVADARAAVEVWRDGRQMYLHAATYCLVCGLLEQDEPGEAAAVLELGDRQQPASAFFAAFRHTAAGHLAARRGDDAAALAAFQAAGRGLTDLLTVNPAVLPWRSEAGLAAHRLGRHDEARSLIEEDVRLAAVFGAPRPIGVAGRAAALLERGDAEVAGLRGAAERLGACGAHVEHVRALVDLGVAIRRGGRPGRGTRDAARSRRAGRDDGRRRARAARPRRAADRRRPRPDGGRERAHTERAPRRRAGRRRPDQPPDRRDAVPDRQVGRVAPRQHVPQARHPRPRRAGRIASRNPGGSCRWRPQ